MEHTAERICGSISCFKQGCWGKQHSAEQLRPSELLCALPIQYVSRSAVHQ